MEQQIFENVGITELVLFLISATVFGLVLKNVFSLLKLGKIVDEHNKDREKYVEIKTKNNVLKEQIVEKQAQREAEIKAAVELIPGENGAEVNEINDVLANEWNKKFGKDR
jgi:ribonuclease HI